MLAASYMESAEIVFTTLSSTGRRAFERGRRFDLVLIDEAAQASEAATLQPLTLGSGRYVSHPPAYRNTRLPIVTGL